jgi:uncharacterized protein (TIGR02145 family)
MKTLFFAALIISKSFALFSQTQGGFLDARDGKVYKTISIGTQIWMAENLNYATENGSWCYDESHAACDTYGRLYDFATAQTACMQGWRLPAKEDYDQLLEFLKKEKDVFSAIKSGGNSGFNSLLSGWRGLNGNSYGQLSQERFWTSSSWIGMNAWFLSLDATTSMVKMDSDNRDLGLSVRCIKMKE